MKNTWKIWITVCVMAVCTLGFAGCGGSEPADNDATTEAAATEAAAEETPGVAKIISRQLNQDAAEYYSDLEDMELHSIVVKNTTDPKEIENEYGISGTVNLIFEDGTDWEAEYEGSCTVDGETCVLHDMNWGDPVKE